MTTSDSNSDDYSDPEDIDAVTADQDDDLPEASDVVEGALSRTVRLPDRSGFLVVEGPGTGRVVNDSGNSAVSDGPTLPTRDDALDGGKPLLLVQRPYAHAGATPRLLAAAHAAFGRNLALGIISKVAGASVESHQNFAANCGAAAVRLVDPEACRIETGDLTFKKASALAVKRAPYLGGAGTSMADYLNMQRERGANLLLTPGRALNAADPQTTLDRAVSDGDEALALLQDGERLALNLPMSPSWLTTENIRDQLFAELVDKSQFDVWYVRVQLPSSQRVGPQPVDDRLIRGWKRLAELAVDEERKLILPQTGLTGWFMLGFGATGFGTGTGGQEQLFKIESGGGNGNVPRIERYFERQILHTIEQISRPVLTVDADYIRCDCPYCPALLQSGAAWNHERAGLHQVYNTARITAAVAAASGRPGGTQGAVRRSVRSAIRFAQGKALTGLSEPTHLPVWDRVL
jgi:hypothetical protein